MSCCEEPVKVPDGYDAVFIIVGYNEKGVFISTEADRDWSYDSRIHFNGIPERYVIFKKKADRTSLKPYTSIFLEDGKVFSTQAEAEGIKTKRKFFS
jgi:hypothetical protein